MLRLDSRGSSLPIYLSAEQGLALAAKAGGMMGNVVCNHGAGAGKNMCRRICCSLKKELVLKSEPYFPALQHQISGGSRKSY